jgi:hypothetical protein
MEMKFSRVRQGKSNNENQYSLFALNQMCVSNNSDDGKAPHVVGDCVSLGCIAIKLCKCCVYTPSPLIQQVTINTARIYNHSINHCPRKQC